MKPTTEQAIELAREAGVLACGHSFDPDEVASAERLVHLALERFGAGGYDWRPADCAPLDGSHFLARTIVGNESVVREAYFSGQRDISGRPIFCVPITKMLCVVHEWTCLPADLRAEYERGLDDAARVCKQERIVKGGEVFAAKIEALVMDAEELAFLKNDLLSWVDHAVEKGNANSDIQDASERYDQWLKTRHAAMQEKQS